MMMVIAQWIAQKNSENVSPHAKNFPHTSQIGKFFQQNPFFYTHMVMLIEDLVHSML